jgi:hypothetical protein
MTDERLARVVTVVCWMAVALIVFAACVWSMIVELLGG